jgi:hypothetical protein
MARGATRRSLGGSTLLLISLAVLVTSVFFTSSAGFFEGFAGRFALGLSLVVMLLLAGLAIRPSEATERGSTPGVLRPQAAHAAHAEFGLPPEAVDLSDLDLPLV